MFFETPTGHLARWALLLQTFDVQVQYVPEPSNVVPDLPSRIPENSRSEAGEPDGATNTEDLGSIDVYSATIELLAGPLRRPEPRS